MKRIIYISLLLLFVACEKEEQQTIILPKNIKTEQLLHLSIAQQISFETDKTVTSFVRYWEEGKESEAKQTRRVKGAIDHNHSILGLKENGSYFYKVITSNEGAVSESEQRSFSTGTIPEEVKAVYNEQENEIQPKEEGHILMNTIGHDGVAFVVDGAGKIVWYKHTPQNIIYFTRYTRNHTIVSLESSDLDRRGISNKLVETNLAGDTLFFLDTNVAGLGMKLHHDVQLDEEGNFLTFNVFYDGESEVFELVRISRFGEVMWRWNPYEHGIEKDPSRSLIQNTLSIAPDGNYIVSNVAIHEVWKINATTGAIMWRLGKDGNVELPVEAYFYRQHYVHYNADGHLMMYDNGHDPERPSSRVLALRMDEANNRAEIAYEIPLPLEYFSPIVGSAQLLSDGGVLSTSGAVGKVVKFDANHNELWTLSIDERLYRAIHLTNTVFDE